MKRLDVFSLMGKRIKRVLVLLGAPTRVDPLPNDLGLTQYRFDNVDDKYVVFLFERRGRVERINLAEKSKWPRWFENSE